MAASLSVAFTPTPLSANTKLAIFATRPLSAGINFQPRGAYKLITVSSAAAVSPLDILSAYQAVYGVEPAAGEKVLVKAKVISSDGLESAVLEAQAIAT